MSSTTTNSSQTSSPEVLYIDGSSEPNEINQGRKKWPIPSEKPVRAGLYYVVPAEVMEDDTLDCSEKILYSLISGLAHNDGYCYASNKHFAERMKCKEREVQRKLEILEKRGYILREVKKIGMYWDRKIYVCHARISKNVNEASYRTPSSCPTGHLQDVAQDARVSEAILVSEEKQPLTPSKGNDEMVSFPPFVKLKKIEYDEFVLKRGKQATDQLIEEINDYQLSTGKKYKDYAATMRSWLRRRDQKPTGQGYCAPKPDKKQRDSSGKDLNEHLNSVF